MGAEWYNSYKKIAESLLVYKDNRPYLLYLLRTKFKQNHVRFPITKKIIDKIDDIDPFTIMAFFNSSEMTIERRQQIYTCLQLLEHDAAEEPYPTELILSEEIPVLDKGTILYFEGNCAESSEKYDALWKLFEVTIKYSYFPTEHLLSIFEESFITCRDICGVDEKKLITGIYWIAPECSGIKYEVKQHRILVRDSDYHIAVDTEELLTMFRGYIFFINNGGPIFNQFLYLDLLLENDTNIREFWFFDDENIYSHRIHTLSIDEWEIVEEEDKTRGLGILDCTDKEYYKMVLDRRILHMRNMLWNTRHALRKIHRHLSASYLDNYLNGKRNTSWYKNGNYVVAINHITGRRMICPREMVLRPSFPNTIMMVFELDDESEEKIRRQFLCSDNGDEHEETMADAINMQYLQTIHPHTVVVLDVDHSSLFSSNHCRAFLRHVLRILKSRQAIVVLQMSCRIWLKERIDLLGLHEENLYYGLRIIFTYEDREFLPLLKAEYDYNNLRNEIFYEHEEKQEINTYVYIMEAANSEDYIGVLTFPSELEEVIPDWKSNHTYGYRFNARDYAENVGNSQIEAGQEEIEKLLQLKVDTADKTVKYPYNLIREKLDEKFSKFTDSDCDMTILIDKEVYYDSDTIQSITRACGKNENIIRKYIYKTGKLSVAEMYRSLNKPVIAIYGIGENDTDEIGEFLENNQTQWNESKHTSDVESVDMYDTDEAGEVRQKAGTPEEGTEDRDTDSLKDAIKELTSLVGLDSIKQEIKTQINFIIVGDRREEMGMKRPEVSRHLVFAGNPGTGKTTVARILAKIYHKMGVLSEGHLLEVDRSKLVGEYVGQSEIKTLEVIENAVGGILFIDEAYSLKPDTPIDYGDEVIETLLKEMEDKRDDLIVIVAGYTDLMKDFIDSNPGLASRFSKYFTFPDYNGQELLEIFRGFCDKNEYVPDEPLLEVMGRYFEELYEHRKKDFGNARTVRNLFEKMVEAQANRLADSDENTKDELQGLGVDDFEEAIKLIQSSEF